jgi:DNA-binding transcriptional regulator YiaG
VNPQHLFLGTNTDNLRDMAAKNRSTHGEKNKGAKLTESQVAAIRATVGQTHQQIADAFGVSRVTIKRIKRRRTWTRT